MDLAAPGAAVALELHPDPTAAVQVLRLQVTVAIRVPPLGDVRKVGQGPRRETTAPRRSIFCSQCSVECSTCCMPIGDSTILEKLDLLPKEPGVQRTFLLLERIPSEGVCLV